MTPKLYAIDRSPPCRSVLLAAKAANIDLTLVEVEITKKEHMTSEFLKLNPQHTLPTLVDDDGSVLWDSHAIMTYLISKYGKSDSLYPKDSYKRAVIDQRLHFDSGVLWSFIRTVIYAIMRDNLKEISKEKFNSAEEIYGFMEKFLENGHWIAGDHISVADFSLYTSAACIDLLIPINRSKFSKILAWFKEVEALPYFDVNKPGHEASKKFLSQFWKI